MSRIDEALKRASCGVDDAAPADRAGAVDDAASVHYPAEGGVFQIRSGPAVASVASSVRAVAATVPRPAPPPREETVADRPELAPKLVVSERTSTLAVEQYRRLAGAIHEIQMERGLKTLMVTSSVPGEGKTLTVSNLGLTLSESYRRRVLLIDADFRRPTLHELFHVSNEEGLGDVLRTSRSEVPFRQVSENLTVLPAGQVDQPMEALTSDAMRDLLQHCAEIFDWVLLDAPPVGVMPDARLLASLTRAVLFVVGAGSTPHQVVSRALAEFERDTVVGTVLNRVQEHDMPGTDYYRGYYAAGQRA
jgi:capsular exopolysaccharide synthesis family protein